MQKNRKCKHNVETKKSSLIYNRKQSSNLEKHEEEKNRKMPQETQGDTGRLVNRLR